MSELTEAEWVFLASIATGHEPLLCDCDTHADEYDDRWCWIAQETFVRVGRILADRASAQQPQPAVVPVAAVQELAERWSVTLVELRECPRRCESCRHRAAMLEGCKADLRLIAAHRDGTSEGGEGRG